MGTKYILNSGGLKNEPERARQFVAEAVSGLGSEARVLLCFFAEPDHTTWAGRYATMCDLLQRWAPIGVRLKCSLASNYNEFVEQVAKSDVIYLHGGSVDCAMRVFSDFNIPSMWQGKVIATNSATTMMLSDSYWSADERVTGKGFGIVPFRTIAHFESQYGLDDPRGPIDWQAAKAELANFGDTTQPLHALKEGRFIVYQTQP